MSTSPITVLSFLPDANPASAGMGGFATVIVSWQLASIDGWLDYVIAPDESLTQTDTTTVAMSALSCGFADTDNTASYAARIFTVTAAGWWYVTIQDFTQAGDPNQSDTPPLPLLLSFCENTAAKVGLPGYVYVGAILASGPTSFLTLPGGWPAPQKIVVGP